MWFLSHENGAALNERFFTKCSIVPRRVKKSNFAVDGADAKTIRFYLSQANLTLTTLTLFRFFFFIF
jgi:hypothetical protein